ncbi:MAG: tetratricopeptide repeat protein [Proteobacteria bacterium]|nr:tetratricopeptide repeat protein [Pseudomonadota bacterium]
MDWKVFFQRRITLALVLAGVGLYGVLFWQYVSRSPFASVPVVDSDFYWNAAREAARGNGLPPVIFNAPLYPLFVTAVVVLTGPSLPTLYILQLALALLAVLFTAWTARRLVSPAAEAMAGFSLLLYLPPAFLAVKILPDTPSLFLLSLFLFLYTRPGKSPGLAVGLGLVGGLMGLARSQFLPVAGLLLILWPLYGPRLPRKQAARFTALALCLFALPLGLWGLRNLHASGRFFLHAPNGGLSFYMGNNENASGAYCPVPGMTSDVNGMLPALVDMASVEMGRPVTLAEADAHFYAKGLEYIRSHPADWLALELRKARIILSPRETGVIYSLNLEKSLHLTVARFFPMTFSLFVPFCLAALIQMAFYDRRAWAALWPFLVTGALLTAALMAFMVATRYRILLLPAVGVTAAYGAVAAWGWVRNRRWLPLTVLALALGWAVYASATGQGGVAAQSLNNLAYAELNSGRFSQAEALSRQVLAARPGDPVALNNLVTALLALGRPDEARPLVDRLADNPVFSENVGIFRERMEEYRDKAPGTPDQRGGLPPERPGHNTLTNPVP